MKTIRSMILAILLIAVPTAPSFADRGDDAESFIQTLNDEALSLVTDESLDFQGRLDRFATMLDQNFDLPWIGQFVLARYWRLATPEQRTAYLELFRDTIVYTYTRRFKDYGGQQIRTTGNQESKNGRFVFVKSEIFDPNGAGKPINLVWRILPLEKGEFRIVDLIIEGVSLGVTQRNEYASVIQRGGGNVQVLIDAMQKNVADLKRSES